jgi:histidine decarboxylase
MGAPWPCGVFMTKRDYQLRPTQVTYIGGSDTTFAGSRNGLSALLMWSYLARTGDDFNRQKARRLQELADYAEKRLRSLDDRMVRTHNEPLYVGRTRNSLTIRFRKLSDELSAKYSLSSDRVVRRIRDHDEARPINVSHLYCMDHVTRDLIDRLVKDIGRLGPGGFDPNLVPDDPARGPRAEIGGAVPNESGGFSP